MSSSDAGVSPAVKLLDTCSLDSKTAEEGSAPEGWSKKLVPAKKTPKRKDVVFIAPNGEEIKSKRQLDKYLKAHPGGPSSADFDWSTGETPRRSARLSKTQTRPSSEGTEADPAVKRAKHELGGGKENDVAMDSKSEEEAGEEAEVAVKSTKPSPKVESAQPQEGTEDDTAEKQANGDSGGGKDHDVVMQDKSEEGVGVEGEVAEKDWPTECSEKVETVQVHEDENGTGPKKSDEKQGEGVEAKENLKDESAELAKDTVIEKEPLGQIAVEKNEKLDVNKQ